MLALIPSEYNRLDELSWPQLLKVLAYVMISAAVVCVGIVVQWLITPMLLG